MIREYLFYLFAVIAILMWIIAIVHLWLLKPDNPELRNLFLMAIIAGILALVMK